MPTPGTDEDEVDGNDGWRDAWLTDGVLLAGRLADETGDVVVLMWNRDGRDEACPHCSPAAIDARIAARHDQSDC